MAQSQVKTANGGEYGRMRSGTFKYDVPWHRVHRVPPRSRITSRGRIATTVYGAERPLQQKSATIMSCLDCTAGAYSGCVGVTKAEGVGSAGESRCAATCRMAALSRGASLHAEAGSWGYG